jgi:hypothetical protein
MEHVPQGCPISRRGLLAGAAAGAVVTGAAVAGPAMVGKLPADAAAGPAFSPQRFGRMFPKLPPFAPNTAGVRFALTAFGAPGGPLDAADDLAAGPVNLITDPAQSLVNRDNPTHTAGTTFLGQFVDHDITFDTTSRLAVPTRPETAPNGRTPSLDLDSIYLGGPFTDPHLYDPADRAKFAMGSGGRFEDVPRDPVTHRALIGDPRNDEHLIVAGLTAAFLLFHNRVVDHVRARSRRLPTPLVFLAARREVTWHYHWIVRHQLLPQVLGDATLGDIVTNGRRFYRPPAGRAFMPVEFQGAAYRFGHSMVRPSYRANLAGNPDGSPFFGFIFDPAEEGKADPGDMRGGALSARRFVGWQTFFDFGDGQVKRNKRIDTRISTPLFHLPLAAIASGDPPTALPQRTLLRQLTWEMPSGQSVAAEIGAPRLAASDLPELAAYGVGLERGTPLWYYVLKEAELMTDGLWLGPVGGRIVGEVLLGLMQLDPYGYLGRQPSWRPTLPAATPGDFTMVDLLRFAGVDPASRGQ